VTRMNRPTFVVLVATLLTVVVVVGAVRLEAVGEPKPQPKKTVSRSKPITRIPLPSDKPENRKVIDVLEKKIVSFTFQEQPLKEALDYFQTLGKINIVLDRTKVEEGVTITLKLTDVSLKTALKLVAEQAQLEYVVRDGVVLISDEEGVKQAPVTAVYDVRDLLKVREGIPLTAKDQSTQTALAELIEIVKATVEPGTWGSQYSVRGSTISGLLVITHVPDVHQRVQELLDMLREARTSGGMSTNTYDVSDILVPAGKRSTTDFSTDPVAKKALDDLVKLVRAAVDADTWDDEEGTRVLGRQGALVVTHRAETMAKVEQLLESLRRKRKATTAGREDAPRPELVTVTYGTAQSGRTHAAIRELLDQPKGSQKVMLGKDTITVTADADTQTKIGKLLHAKKPADGLIIRAHGVQDLLITDDPGEWTITPHHPAVKKAQQRLVTQIMLSVAPGTWDAGTGRDVWLRNFHLYIRHTPEVQAKVDVFLAKKKRLAAEARRRLLEEERRRHATDH